MSEEKIVNINRDDAIAKTGFMAGINPTMGIASMILIICFVGFTIMDVENAKAVFDPAKDFVIGNFGWFSVLLMSALFFFALVLPFTRFGSIKLGKDDDEPDFSTFSWICMLFSAGMGSGMLYWGVAEPILHFQDNPFLAISGVEPKSIEAASVGLRVTLFHWGMHGWGVYVLFALSLSYFSYRHDLPLTPRSAFYPILKEKIYGPWGHAIDVFALFGTIFGLATSLGMGVVPINAGLDNVMGFATSVPNQIILIAIIAALGTASAVSGVGKGVRILSELNVWLSILVMVVFFILGPTSFIVSQMLTLTGEYITNVVSMGFYLESDPDSQWQSWWTLFYWAWWIAWCPFVGLFIARISKGRTIREFCICVLIIPSTVLIIWLSVLGGGAIGMELFGKGGISEAVNTDYSLGIFKAIEGLSWSWIVTPMTILTTFLLISWFVTSSDSGTLVVCTILSMGAENPPIKFRLFWGLMLGVVAGVLLLAGGLGPLQTATIVTALPLSVLLILVAYGLIKTLYEEHPAPSYVDKRDKIFLTR